MFGYVRANHHSNSSRRIAIAIIFFSLCLFNYSWFLNLFYGSNLESYDLSAYSIWNQDPRCKNFPDPGNIVIAVKTGATEAAGRIPTQMRTSLRCAQNVRIFSDLEETIEGYQLHDALDTISPTITEKNPDFKFYFDLKEAKKNNKMEDIRNTRKSEAWTLDKYKQLHLLEKLYAEYPDKDWYLILDADTYLVWSNLVLWLRELGNPSKMLYLGSPASFQILRFAHGGSGILVSHATLYNLAVTWNGTAAKWDKVMHNQCCGDLVIGLALMKRDIILKESWPTFNGEKPITMPFGERLWCHPVATMHHVDPDEMKRIMKFENSKLDAQKPLTFADLYHKFVKNKIPDTLDNWDNLSKASLFKTNSYEACQETCRLDASCFQFTYGGEDDCKLGDAISFGQQSDKDAIGKTWRSGWLRDRIDEWVERQGSCEPKFPWTGL